MICTRIDIMQDSEMIDLKRRWFKAVNARLEFGSWYRLPMPPAVSAKWRRSTHCLISAGSLLTQIITTEFWLSMRSTCQKHPLKKTCRIGDFGRPKIEN